MLVSIVVPTYKNQESLSRCLKSLEKICHNDFEIIVSEAKGRSRARNKGIAKAKGEIIAFIDSDCVAHENWLGNLVKSFAEKIEKTEKNIVGVSGRVVYVEEGFKSPRWERRVENPNAKWPMSGNIAYRADVLKKLGGFDESFERYEDKELALRMWKFGKIVAEPSAIVYHEQDKTDWPNWEMVDSSAHWVRLKKMHDLSLDKNNPAPFYGKVLMPRKFCGILWRLVALPILLVMCLLQSRWAKFQIKWLWFLILERGEIWKCSFKC